MAYATLRRPVYDRKNLTGGYGEYYANQIEQINYGYSVCVIIIIFLMLLLLQCCW